MFGLQADVLLGNPQLVQCPCLSQAARLYRITMTAFPLLTEPFILAALAMLIAAPAVSLFLRRRKPWLSRLRRKPLLTANEAEVFHRLQRALPGFHVFPQVSFSAFVTDDGQLSSKAQWAVRAKMKVRTLCVKHVSRLCLI